MLLTDKVESVLQRKGSHVWTIHPDATVYGALVLMAEKNVGALVVLSADRVTGMLSERDYARKLVLQGRASRETLVRDIMSTRVVCVSLNHRIDQCMHLMTRHRVRHLPVLQNERLVGLLSIGDLTSWIISAQAAMIDQLESYIYGQGAGVQGASPNLDQ
jgi:CBS domain-containing protein